MRYTSYKHSLFAAIAATICGLATAQAQIVVTAPTNPIVGVAATIGSATSTLATVGTVAGANNYPAAEGPTNAIDNLTTTKYLNFQETGAGLIVTPTALSTLTGVRFATANDAPERDPLTISIEGTNGANATTTLNSPWTLIYNGVSGLATDPGRGTQGATINFTNTLSFASYRVLVQTVRDGAVANSFQFSEVGLLAPIPEPTSLALVGVAGAGLVIRRLRRKV